MKQIITILLLAVMLIQQTLAFDELLDYVDKRDYEDELSFIQPPNDDSYPIYDFIVTASNNFTMYKMTIYGQAFVEILAADNGFSDLEKETAYRDIKPFMETLDKLHIDPDNCDLQRKVRELFIPFQYRAEILDGRKKFHRMAASLAERKMKKPFQEFYKNFSDELTVVAHNYLDTQPKPKGDLGSMPILWIWSHLVSNETDVAKKQHWIGVFFNFFFVVNRVDVVDEDKPHCKWDLKISKDFIKYCDKNSVVREKYPK